jgi:hypothetical protein
LSWLRKSICWGCLLLVAGRVLAEDAVPPTIRSFAGTFLGANDHSYFVESELRLPIAEITRAVISYHYRESTPFLRETGGPQAEVLARRQEGEINIELAEGVYATVIGGYRSTYRVDRTGFLSAYTIGGGIGSGPQRAHDRLCWSLAGGALLSPKNFTGSWWADLHGEWWAVDFAQDQYLGSSFWGSLSLVGDLETLEIDGALGSFFRFGPAFQLRTANGNRAELQLLWYHNDNNHFLGVDENAFLFGIDVTSPLDRNEFLHTADERERGWLPVIWGVYDLGFAPTRQTSRFEMNVELVDFNIVQQPFTAVVWYESRQEYREQDFDNIAYSVALGVQTPVGLASIASHGEPLILGSDFLHRSDHALNPGPEQLPPSGQVAKGSHNLIRLRLQTPGWELPYRDPQMYNRQTEWLNVFDWRVTGGWDKNDTRRRGPLTGQLGLNWDIATVQGYVAYLTGEISAGNETPDWMAECGVRRPIGRIFARYESYGIKHDIAQGDTFTVGFGVNL